MEKTSKNNWFFEDFTENAKFGIRIKKHLVDTSSEFQKIDFYDSYEFGTFFTLDGFIMLTERDEFIYHEMISHVPVAAHMNTRDILIIGGGDGGTARELLRYPFVETIDLVEIDGLVIELCKKHLQKTAISFDDPRLHVFIEDGVAFVQNAQKKYDLIIIDSTDPIGVGEGLFTHEFYSGCKKLLKSGGILINQHESPYYANDAAMMARAHKRLREVFKIAKVYQFHMPTYASGHWLFGFASDDKDPVSCLQADTWNSLNLKTGYYNTALHAGCFCLPVYVNNLLNQ